MPRAKMVGLKIMDASFVEDLEQRNTGKKHCEE